MCSEHGLDRTGQNGCGARKAFSDLSDVEIPDLRLWLDFVAHLVHEERLELSNIQKMQLSRLTIVRTVAGSLSAWRIKCWRIRFRDFINVTRHWVDILIAGCSPTYLNLPTSP